jgi:glycine/D-amino acid oxidase-like deaminating enzyme
VTSRADLIVVGAGLAGSAAAWIASSRGMSVVVLEAFGAGHGRGSSHGSARIFRRAYPDPLYVGLTGRAEPLWRKLEAESGEPLLRLTGGLDFGPLRDPATLHEVLTSCGVPADLLSPAEAAERWPGISFGAPASPAAPASAAGPVMFHADAGVLDPDRAMAAMLRLAASRGADVRFDTPVTRLEAAPGGDGAIAHTDSGTFAAPVAVVAAGGWLAPLLGDLVRLPPLVVTQQQAFHLAPRAVPDRPAGSAPSGTASADGDAPWPIFIFRDEADHFYGLPAGRDGEVPGAVKLGEHHVGVVTTASGRDGIVDAAGRARATAFAARRLPGLDPEPVGEISCLYTTTASEDFILDRQGPFVIASPCSGHGAKFAPILGEILADLAVGKPSPSPRFTLAAHLAAT